MIRSLDDSRLRRWRDALGAAGASLPTSSDCPSSEQIWEAARGLLDPDSLRELLDHASRCPGCSLAWRLAAEIDPGATASDEGTTTPIARHSSRRWMWALAAAVLGVALLAPVVLLRRADTGDELRSAAETSIASLVEGQSLDREDCVLRWTPVPDTLSYSVLVGSEDLDVVARADGLDANELQVPPERLEGLGSGARLVWRVEAHLEDGGSIRSPSFVNPLR